MKKIILCCMLLGLCAITKANNNQFAAPDFLNFLVPQYSIYIDNELGYSAEITANGSVFNVPAHTSGWYSPFSLTVTNNVIIASSQESDFELLDNLSHSNLTSNGSAALQFNGSSSVYKIKLLAS